MATDSKCGKMAASMMANGRMTKQTATAFSFTQMAMSTKALGAMTKLMVTEHTNTQTVQLMLASGLKISSMVEESRSGPMVLNMKGNTKTERSTVKAASPSQTAARTADRLRIMRFLELANTFGQMAKCMKANGKGTKCMAMECLYGATVKGMKDNL